MSKKVIYKGSATPQKAYPDDNTVVDFYFTMVDLSFVGKPREKSKTSSHTVRIIITNELLVNWGWMDVNFTLIINNSDLLKVLFWYAVDYIEDKIKNNETLLTQRSVKFCQ